MMFVCVFVIDFYFLEAIFLGGYREFSCFVV